jgi:hypothetical protein
MRPRRITFPAAVATSAVYVGVWAWYKLCASLGWDSTAFFWGICLPVGYAAMAWLAAEAAIHRLNTPLRLVAIVVAGGTPVPAGTSFSLAMTPQFIPQLCHRHAVGTLPCEPRGAMRYR